jgi:hypothetical protein
MILIEKTPTSINCVVEYGHRSLSCCRDLLTDSAAVASSFSELWVWYQASCLP